MSEPCPDRSGLTVRLAVAVHGDNARPPVNADDYDLDTLLWEVGEMRRQIELAHLGLDLMGAPRKSLGGELTLRGRIEDVRAS